MFELMYFITIVFALITVGICIFFFFLSGFKNPIQLKRNNGITTTAPIGFSWATFFFGPLVPLFRGDAKWCLIMLLVIAPISHFILFPMTGPFIGGLFITKSSGFDDYLFATIINYYFDCAIIDFIFAFFYNDLYIKEMLFKGWEPATEADRRYLVQKGFLS